MTVSRGERREWRVDFSYQKSRHCENKVRILKYKLKFTFFILLFHGFHRLLLENCHFPPPDRLRPQNHHHCLQTPNWSIDAISVGATSGPKGAWPGHFGPCVPSPCRFLPRGEPHRDVISTKAPSRNANAPQFVWAGANSVCNPYISVHNFWHYNFIKSYLS